MLTNICSTKVFFCVILFLGDIFMDISEKLNILADSAKYDVSCSSSGSNRKNKNGIGNASASGICHSFASDGRCISLLKILMSNNCIYDCKYCINKKSNTIKRATFTSEEIAQLTINFYKRNYIEGLFLSSGIIKNSDYTMEKMYDAVYLLRNKYNYHGYIHVKTIPGASKQMINKIGILVDRMSINIELPSDDSLKLLAPNKEKNDIVTPMRYVSKKIKEEKKFSQAGQTTQMIIGATKESDQTILTLTENMYNIFNLKRVYYSAYIAVNKDNLLPLIKEPNLIRENRLYQADWLLRFYKFKASDLLNENNPNFNYLIDPKTYWALSNLNKFPVEINEVSYDTLLRIPGVGLLSAKKIYLARKYNKLTFDDLKKMKVVLKRAKYFITCNGKYFIDAKYFNKNYLTKALIYNQENPYEQLSLFE